jgi:hypothetical protein
MVHPHLSLYTQGQLSPISEGRKRMLRGLRVWYHSIMNTNVFVEIYIYIYIIHVKVYCKLAL